MKLGKRPKSKQINTSEGEQGVKSGVLAQSKDKQPVSDSVRKKFIEGATDPNDRAATRAKDVVIDEMVTKTISLPNSEHSVANALGRAIADSGADIEMRRVFEISYIYRCGINAFNMITEACQNPEKKLELIRLLDGNDAVRVIAESTPVFKRGAGSGNNK